MPGQQRPASGPATRRTAIRQPSRRVASATIERSESPAEPLKPANANLMRVQRSPSTQSVAGSKRKDREYDLPTSEDTNIHVVVRCRGRNEREIKENSGVVVATEGVKGKTVELSMGPNAVSNKTYHFDKVFSPAADQAIIFEDVVAPMLNEMLSGYNCTIFAYGQTGTGKTYTMSGDMNDTLGLLSDNAGIIPRVLYALFRKLEETEHTVKCSFIELYNEELRDLLSPEENSKLKIYENEPKKGSSNGSTLVQGMEETYIDSASAGIKLLQTGSHRRQVAATKCNDLSSRSHTIFTITTYVKRTTEAGEEYISSGKLNLVDLAGSENIQRSGADNKRAAEAGLINKSLLTLGRVINALVDKSSHIPYRESKLTRLLQDSLGGQTKTCIIATISPARSNLEETISTLDYAFRAKNIRNKPQINSTMSKKTLLREFTAEIEKLKSELIATRHRNGVYLTTEAYEELTVESESRRIVTEEQRAKIETMEASLRNKVQELFTLTSNFNNLKKDNEETRAKLEETNDLLEKTEIVLRDTKRQLEQEEMLRKAHQDTEEQLYGIGTELLSKLDQTVEHVNGLHSKLRRKSDLHKLNRETWEASTADVIDVTKLVDARMEAFQSQHSSLVADLSKKISQFVASELDHVQSNQSELNEYTSRLDEAETRASEQTSKAHDEMNEVLEEIKVLREEVKGKVGEGLNGLSAAAERISEEVISELTEFHTELRSSYTSLRQDFKAIFERIMEHLEAQKAEVNELRSQLQEANRRAMEANEVASTRLQQALEEERENAEADRADLLSQIKLLIEDSGQKQAARLKSRVDGITSDMASSGEMLEQASNVYHERMKEWTRREDQLIEEVASSRDTIENRMEKDWNIFDERNASIQRATESVHQETVRIVDAQMQGMASQMEALDDFVTKARSQDGLHHERHLDNLKELTTSVRGSYAALQDRFTGLGNRVRTFQDDVLPQKDVLEESVAPFSEDVRNALTELRTNIENAPLKEYKPTGTTPPRTSYEYPTVLPRTESHETLIAKLRQAKTPALSPLDGEEPGPLLGSPSKTRVYNDAEDEVGNLQPTTTAVTSSNTGLREVDINVVARPLNSSANSSSPDLPAGSKSSPEKAISPIEKDNDMEPPPLKKQHLSTPATTESKLPQIITRRMAAGMLSDGRENAMPLSLPSGGGPNHGRRLRNRPSSG